MTESKVPPHEAARDAELGDRARHLAEDAGKQFMDRANESGAKGFESMGKRLDEAADYVRSRGSETARRVHVDEEHARRVADGMHGAAEYLRSNDPRSMLTDLDRAIQKHPYRALVVGAAIGYAVGRLLRRD